MSSNQVSAVLHLADDLEIWLATNFCLVTEIYGLSTYQREQMVVLEQIKQGAWKASSCPSFPHLNGTASQLLGVLGVVGRPCSEKPTN